MQKKIEKFIYIILFTSLLTSCSEKVINNPKVTSLPLSQEGISSSSTTSTETIQEWNWIKKELKISARCIWCGHCVKFAVDNFKMNFSKHKAEVISQNNIYSDWVERSINRCPVNAISIS